MGFNASEWETIHLIAKEVLVDHQGNGILFMKSFFFLLFRFGEFYLSVLKFTASVLSSALYN